MMKCDEPYPGMPVLYNDYGTWRTAFVNDIQNDGDMINVIFYNSGAWYESTAMTKIEDFNDGNGFWKPIASADGLEAMTESVVEARLRELCTALRPVMSQSTEVIDVMMGTERRLMITAAHERAEAVLGKTE